MKALILVALLGMTAQSASAYDNFKEFFFKVTVTAQPTGAGKVYVNNVTVEYDSLYAETGEDIGFTEKGYDEGDPEPESGTGERELWAKPNPGCTFVGWSTAENPDSILSTDLHYTAEFPVTSTDTLNRTTYNYVAHFELLAPKFSPMATDGETVQYLYNVDTHTFMLGANDWNTRASVSASKGYQFKIADNGNGTYTLNDYVENQSAWKAVFAGNPTDIWVDNLNGANVKGWVITSAGENLYKITNPGAGAGELSVLQDLSDTRLNLNPSLPEAYAATWAFVNEADYAEYIAAANAETITAVAAAKKAQVTAALQEIIDEANYASLAARENLINATNIYDEAAAKTFADKTAELKALVEAGNYTEKIVNPNAATGWHASTDYNFLLTPWTIGGEQANNFDKALYINTWSVEGISDGSNFLVPFFEYWTGDANSLAQNTLATTVSGLVPNGKYTVYATARVRVKDNGGETANGITFSAGEASVNVCDGEAYGPMFVKNVSVEGTADAEGNLAVAFNVAADNNISWLSYKDVYVEESVPTPEHATVNSLNLDTTIDEDGYMALAVDYEGENFSGMYGDNIVMTDMIVEILDGEEKVYEASNGAYSDTIYVNAKDLVAGKEYTLNLYTDIISMDMMTWDDSHDKKLAGTTTFTIVPAPELAVSLIANDTIEYALNSHSIVTIDEPISAIKVAGLDQVQDSVTYAIYGMDKATLAEGLLSVNTIGYAEFAPVTLYEGNQYNVVIAIKDSVLFDQIVIGAAEPAEIEIAATLNNGKTALNTHSSVSAEVVNNFEVSFDGVVPMQAGYSISTMKQEADSTGIVWAADSTLAQGALSLSGKGYAELEEPVFLLAGTKYLLVVSYQTFDGQNGYAEFQIDGACEDPSAIYAIATSANANGKFLEKGKIVIVKNGKKYNVAGSIVK